MNGRALWAMVKKEFLDNVRNRWIVAMTFVFLSLAILTSYLGGSLVGGGVGFQGFRETSIGILTLGVLLVPIIAIMLGYASLAGEQEQGSLSLLLSTPISRGEVLLGKFLGLSAILAVSIAGGFGAAGLSIAGAVGTEGADVYAILLGGTILHGLSFLSTSLLLSSLTARRSTALGLGVLLWFFLVMIYNTILIGVFVATGGQLPIGAPSGPLTLDFPAWLWAFGLVNPNFAYRFFALLPTGTFSVAGISFGDVPGYVNLGTTALSMVLWTLVPLVLAYGRFRRRDL